MKQKTFKAKTIEELDQKVNEFIKSLGLFYHELDVSLSVISNDSQFTLYEVILYD